MGILSIALSKPQVANFIYMSNGFKYIRILLIAGVIAIGRRYIRKLWTGIKNERILEYQQTPKSLGRGRKDTLRDTIYTLRSRKDSQR